MTERSHMLKGLGFVKHLSQSTTLLKLSVLSAALLILASLAACSFEFRKEKNGGMVQAQVDADYKSIKQNLVNPQCLRCHLGPGSPHGVDLSSYDTILNSGVFPPLVVPGSPERSSLYISVSAGRMPKDRPRLSESAIGALYEWIKNGAKEIEDASPLPSPIPDEPGDEPADERGGEPRDEPGSSSGEPRDHTTSPEEPCDQRSLINEPGFLKCSS